VSGRLILAIVSTLLEEAALAVIVLVGLPELGVNIPLPVLIALMVVWTAVSVVTYLAGSRALKRKPATGMEAMVGSQGKTVSPLDPEGLVKIGGELWQAKSAGNKIGAGEEVTVVAREGKKLIVTQQQR